jgi:hypothetical protein
MSIRRCCQLKAEYFHVVVGDEYAEAVVKGSNELIHDP